MQATVIPPAAVAAAARRGLELRASQPPSNRCCTSVGLRRASQLANRQPVSESTLKRMASYFSRHAVDAQGKGWRVDSKGWQAWLLWGGDEAVEWLHKLGYMRRNPDGRTNASGNGRQARANANSPSLDHSRRSSGSPSRRTHVGVDDLDLGAGSEGSMMTFDLGLAEVLSAPAVQNPFSPAVAKGLYARMVADGATTFAKKVSWVKKHIPDIDDPASFVAVLVRQEEGMATKKAAPKKAAPKKAATKKAATKKAAPKRNPGGIREFLAERDNQNLTWWWMKGEQKFEFSMPDGQRIPFHGTYEQARRDGKWDRAVSVAVEGPGYGTFTVIKSPYRAGTRRNPGPDEHKARARQSLQTADDMFFEAEGMSHPERKIAAYMHSAAKAHAAGQDFADASDGKGVKEAQDLFRRAREEALEVVGGLKSRNPNKTVESHNFCVHAKDGRLVAYTTTLAEAQSVMPKGGHIKPLM